MGISPVKNIITPTLGVAAANAKVLADNEERKIGYLVANIIETQLKKLQDNVKHFEDLKLFMENKNAQLEEAEQSLIAERLDALKRVFDAGISRSKEHNLTKYQTDSLH